MVWKKVCKSRNEFGNSADLVAERGNFAANKLFCNFVRMKTRPLIFECLLLLMTCSQPNREAPKLLRQAESIIETYPDSALRLIDSVMHMEIYFSEAERMEMALLQGQAIYGDDRDATDPTKPNGNIILEKVINHIYTSPDLDRAPAYFAKKGQPKEAALAALYKGYDLQSVYVDSLALQSFKEAVRYGVRANDSLTVARACFQKGRLLYLQDKYEEAAAALDSADQFFGRNLYQRAFVQNMMCLNYRFMEEFDKAVLCYNNCLALATESGNDEAEWRVLFNYGTMLGGEHFDRRDDGLLILRLLNTEDTGLKLATKAYGMKELFFNHNVRHKIKPLSDDSTHYYSSVWASAMPFSRKYKIGGADEFCYYGRQHDLYPIFLTHWITADETYYGEVYGMIKNYARQQQRNDYLALRNAMAEKENQKQHKTLVFCVVAIAALLLIIGALLYWLKRKPKAEEPVAEKEAGTKVASVEGQTEVAPAEAETPMSGTHPFVSQEIVARLRLILNAVRTEKRANDIKKEWSPLVRQVMNGKETAFEAAASVIESAYPGLQAKIKEFYPDLNETDSKVCLLSCSDITNTEMGEILELSVYSINKSRSELRKKLGFEPGELKNRL